MQREENTAIPRNPAETNINEIGGYKGEESWWKMREMNEEKNRGKLCNMINSFYLLLRAKGKRKIQLDVN